MKFWGMKPTCKIALGIRRRIVWKTNLSRHETSSFKKLRALLGSKQEIHHRRWTLWRSRDPFDWYFPFIHSTSKGYALIAASDQRPNQSISSTILPFHATNSKPSSYIEDGYSITLTDAPKDLGGRLFLNCARTTPELPEKKVRITNFQIVLLLTHTMWPGDLSPDDPNLWSSNLSLRTVNESNLLSEVEAVTVSIFPSPQIKPWPTLLHRWYRHPQSWSSWCLGWCCACRVGNSSVCPCWRTYVSPIPSP
jgi:hypothetical protein